jgi:hypothetical protein
MCARQNFTVPHVLDNRRTARRMLKMAVSKAAAIEQLNFERRSRNAEVTIVSLFIVHRSSFSVSWLVTFSAYC